LTRISEAEFSRIVDGIVEDREAIVRHNPIGPDEEVLLWMLLACMTSYLSLSDLEMPCFTGKPDAETYRNAIRSVLSGRSTPRFDPEPYLMKLSS
jgi:hypothetical protein